MGRLIDRLRSWISRHIAADCPPELDECESCREVNCTVGMASKCERRRVCVGEVDISGLTCFEVWPEFFEE